MSPSPLTPARALAVHHARGRLYFAQGQRGALAHLPPVTLAPWMRALTESLTLGQTLACMGDAPPDLVPGLSALQRRGLTLLAAGEEPTDHERAALEALPLMTLDRDG